MNRLVRIGTRTSPLAVAQARWVRDALQEKWPHLVFDIVPVVTEGDERLVSRRDESPDFKRAFTRRLEEALLDGRLDVAVHSLKDLPVELPDGLEIGGVPRRELPWDALVSRHGRTFEQLPEGAVVGTSSLRRAMQVQMARPRLRVVPLDGNVDTRLRKLDAENLDAIVLAAAGLRRLGQAGRITHLFDASQMVPAVGQGALALEVRAGNGLGRSLAQSVEDPTARAEVEAERAVARALGADCNAPMGAVARARPGGLQVDAVACGPVGGPMVRASRTGASSDPVAVGRAVGQELLRGGAAQLLGAGGAG